MRLTVPERVRGWSCNIKTPVAEAGHENQPWLPDPETIDTYDQDCGMDGRGCVLHRSDEAAHRRDLRHLHDLRRSGRRNPNHDRARRAGDRRRCRHGRRARRAKFEGAEPTRRTEARVRRRSAKSSARRVLRRSICSGPFAACSEKFDRSRDPADPADQAGADCRSAENARRRHCRQPGDGTARRGADAVPAAES